MYEPIRSSTFCIAENCVNQDVRVQLQTEEERIGIRVDSPGQDDGYYEWHMVQYVSKESLAECPVKLYMMIHGTMKYVKVGYNLSENRLTLRYMGILAERLPNVNKNLQIYQNKIENTANDKIQ